MIEIYRNGDYRGYIADEDTVAVSVRVDDEDVRVRAMTYAGMMKWVDAHHQSDLTEVVLASNVPGTKLFRIPTDELENISVKFQQARRRLRVVNTL